MSQALKARIYAQLHNRAECFLLPNAWDAGSAKFLASSGFETIATTSAGLAFTLGRRDAEAALSHEETIANCEAIATISLITRNFPTDRAERTIR